jgi:hypothetical protein
LTLQTGTGGWRMMVIGGLGILPLEVQGMAGVVVISSRRVDRQQASRPKASQNNVTVHSCTSTSRCKAPSQACPLNTGLVQKRHGESRRSAVSTTQDPHETQHEFQSDPASILRTSEEDGKRDTYAWGAACRRRHSANPPSRVGSRT